MACKRKRSDMDDGKEGAEFSMEPDFLRVAMEQSDISPGSYVVKVQEVDDNEEIQELDDNSATSMSVEAEVVQEAPPLKRQVKFEVYVKKATFQCEWNMCHETFKKMERFCQHIADHLAAPCRTTEEGFVCIWRECDYDCTSKEELDRHVYFHAFHTKVKAVGAVVMSMNSGECVMESSVRNMIPEIPENFQCMWSSCEEKFISAQHFYWHVQYHISCADPEPDTQYKCYWQGCSSMFKISSRLSDHSRSHTQEKRVGCPNCGGLYTNNTKFFDHYLRQIPLNKQQYQCSHCSIRFANVRMLRDHVRRHVNHFKCNECEMTCSTKATLVAHIRYRHLDLRPHKCAVCSKGFKSVMDLNRHMSVHCKDPAYGCPYADCEFESRSMTCLNTHIKLVHNGMAKEPYVCHICDSRFKTGTTLTRHLINVHKFHWPAGHSRFRYKQDEDGFYRLQTIRYESVELMHEGDENLQEEAVDSPDPLSAPSTPATPATPTTPVAYIDCSSVSSNQPLSQIDCKQDSQPLSQIDFNQDANSSEKMMNRVEKALSIQLPSAPKPGEYLQIITPF